MDPGAAHAAGRHGAGRRWLAIIFDLLHLDGDDVGARPLIERKSRLAELLSSVAPPLHYSDYHRAGTGIKQARPA